MLRLVLILLIGLVATKSILNGLDMTGYGSLKHPDSGMMSLPEYRRQRYLLNEDENKHEESGEETKHESGNNTHKEHAKGEHGEGGHGECGGEEHEGSIPLLMTFLLISMLFGSLISSIDEWLQSYTVPYTFCMFIFGMIYAGIHERHFDSLVLEIDPQLILLVLLPALLVEDSMSINFHTFRKLLPSSLTLAFPGVIIATVLTGCFVKLLYPHLGWMELFLLGSVLSATDPVAVLNSLAALGAPAKLSVLIAGESLLNDGSAYVLFQIFRLLAYQSEKAGESLDNWFILITVGPVWGIAVGIVLHHWVYSVTSPILETTALVAATFFCFLLGDHYFASSGVLATVCFGLFMAHGGQWSFSPQGLEHTECVLSQLAHQCNSLIFVLAGYVTYQGIADQSVKPRDWGYLLALFIGLHLVRGLVVFSFRPLLNNWAYGLDKKEATIVVFGGMRGAIGLALALILKNDPCVSPDNQSLFSFLISGIVLLSTIFNGFGVPILYRKLHMYERENEAETKQRIYQSAMKELEEHTRDEIKHECMSDWLLLRAYWPRALMYSLDFELISLDMIANHQTEQSKSPRSPGRSLATKSLTAQGDSSFDNEEKKHVEEFIPDLKSLLKKHNGELAALYLACDRAESKQVNEILGESTAGEPEGKNHSVTQHSHGTEQKVRGTKTGPTFRSYLGKDIVITFFHALQAHYKHQFHTKYLTESALVMLLSSIEEAIDLATEGQQGETNLLEGPLKREWDELEEELSSKDINNTTVVKHMKGGCCNALYKWEKIQGVALTIEALGGFIRAHSHVKEKMLEDEHTEKKREQLDQVDQYIIKAKRKVIELQMVKEKDPDQTPVEALMAITVLAARSVLRLKRHKIDEMYEEGFLLSEWKEALTDIIDHRDRELENYKSNMIKIPFINVDGHLERGQNFEKSAIGNLRKKVLKWEMDKY